MHSINKKFTKNFIPLILLIFFMGVFLLARTFMGVYIFGFRIGEYSILLSTIFFFFSLMQYKYQIIKNHIPMSIVVLLALLSSSFLLFVVLSNGNFLNMYIYKSSSYIWSFGFLFIGGTISNYLNFKKEIFFLFLLILTYIYFLSIYGIPENLQNQFLKYSDKFEYHKGSDILIMFLSIFFIGNRTNFSKNFRLDIFIYFGALFLPLLLYKSRGAFIAFLLYFILELNFLKSDFRRPLKKNLILILVTGIIFLQSVSIVNKNGPIEVDEISANLNFLVEYRQVPVGVENIANNFLFIENSRLFSRDGNLNWRLQIWQDMIEDLISEQNLLIGFGYDEKFPAMNDPFRSGDDGTNENVPNSFINVLGRGGLTHLTLYLGVYYFLVKKLISINNIYILNFIIPVIFASFFDASMENSHFPLLFYFIIGLMFNTKNKKDN